MFEPPDSQDIQLVLAALQGSGSKGWGLPQYDVTSVGRLPASPTPLFWYSLPGLFGPQNRQTEKPKLI